MPNFVEIGPSIADSAILFFDLTNGRSPHLGYLKLQNFIGCQVPES